jgi:hypothetical protein
MGVVKVGCYSSFSLSQVEIMLKQQVVLFVQEERRRP